ncbi:hypothetical protein N7457_004007 [Penicillium paradoxum]|uniref:uncharacterized protein n=1 Tax=Penicillium paradoxum TaxID=176176 RepID=UPI002549A6BF|nr:uncharacterized protein N7457_004007 [Penicillium paradoxum]KAJ5782233.1 hypothetical protein N7457_004007 [Penicillium paradoxum]
MTTISSIIQTCLKQLDDVIVSAELEEYQSDILPDLWTDELGRLRVWTANIGAHQTGQSSLDYRLRDASHLKDQTLRVLGRLQRTIQDLQSFLYEPGFKEGFSSDSDDSEDEGRTEIQAIFHSLRDTINILFQNSMSIRRPAQHDRLVGVKRSDTAVFEPFDRQHVENKYPHLDSIIIDRLGLAISQRRATLRYRERHHFKLAQGLDQVINDRDDSQSAMLSETVATEFVEKPVEDYFDMQSIASQTSYSRTLIGGGSGPIIPPAPKDSLNGDPFECPYCFILIIIENKHSWARHVLHDLMPYVCVFNDCRTPHRLWESRRQWYIHLKDEHSIPQDSGVSVDCPLCGLSVNSGRLLERHLGRHLQELALFALPQSGLDQDDESSTSKKSEGGLSQSDYEDEDGFDAKFDNDPDVSISPDENHLPESSLSYDMSETTVLEHPISHNPTTHGINKAKAGTRVRACGYPGCNKVYAHEETSHSHQQVYHNKEFYRCSHLDCNNTFHRADLLEHHMERHQLKTQSKESPHYGQEANTGIGTLNEENPCPRKGKTRLPRGLVHIDAILDLGYPFKEEADTFIILKALSTVQIDEVIGLSREFKEPEDQGTNAAYAPITTGNEEGKEDGIPSAPQFHTAGIIDSSDHDFDYIEVLEEETRQQQQEGPEITRELDMYINDNTIYRDKEDKNSSKKSAKML